MQILRKAKIEETGLLTDMSKAAFDSDILVGGEGGGPTGYDSMEWHLDKCMNDSLYAMEVDGEVVGGAILKKDAISLYIYRIFINPVHYRKGYGKLMMKEIENVFEGVTTFWLDTPAWNTRTNPFYIGCGYRKVGVKETPWFELNIYEKNVFDAKTEGV